MTNSGDERIRSWDVVILPFPFTDRNAAKVRPAVVVSSEVLHGRAGKYFLAMITSAGHAPVEGDVGISDLDAAGLPVDSRVRPSKLATVERSAFRKRIGTLPKADRLRVLSALHRFLAP
ncbi:MAG: type II toxin-antitoxin system PemK/MazF family toxin [Betaproteobacteria bacterium]|nr:type II toxin-antitoxin system PemK/MazF family toxin [Betaproteobacteria bacterium]